MEVAKLKKRKQSMISNKAEFSTLCGISSRELAVYIKRNKVLLTGDKIDDSNAVNQMFLQKMQSRNRKSKVQKSPVIKDKKGKKEKAHDNESGSVDRNELTEQLKQKGILDLQNRKNAIILQEMEIQKKNGELIPTEAIKSLVIALSESMKNAYYEAGENLIIDMSTRKQFSSGEISEMKTNLRNTVNKSLESAIRTCKKSLAKIVEDYSEKRGVGQHG